MKQRLLINIHYLEIGGAESSLIGLLHFMDPSEYNVDLMINDKRGELLKYIPDWVNVLDIPSDYSMIERPIVEVIKKGFIKIALARLWAKYRFNEYSRKKNPKDGSAIYSFVAKYVTPLLPDLNYLGEYDVAISYLMPHNIVRDKIKARKKVCWIHTDYSAIDVNSKLELPVLSEYDKIVSISDSVTYKFHSVFPELNDKIVKVEPILSRSLIEGRSLEFVPTDMQKGGNETIILTIGRYCYAKNLESIPYICKTLIENGLNVRWYIIGYGGSDQYIRDEIEKNDIEGKVVLLGKKENPYPYIKACDWYIQPSRYEGNSITVKEAQLLEKPVIITNYPTAASQINQGVDGFIGPYDIDDFARYIANLLRGL